MAKQRIGNVGVLNLTKATEQSVANIEKIENVGCVLYKPETAHLITSLNIGNIGKTLEMTRDFTVINGQITLDQAFFSTVEKPLSLLVNGQVVIGKDVAADDIREKVESIVINGAIYAPREVAGALNERVKDLMGGIKTYEGELPRTVNGSQELTNRYLQSIGSSLQLVVNGVLTLAEDLDMSLFQEKIEDLEVNGVIRLYETQEPALFNKAPVINGVTDVIPDGYEHVGKALTLTERSIRRFKGSRLYTNKPVVLEPDVTREALEKAIVHIRSSSVIVCHEDLEDLLFERCDPLETEVLTYSGRYALITDETWSREDLEAFDDKLTLIVTGTLRLGENVDAAALRSKVDAIDLLGSITSPNAEVKGAVMTLLRTKDGEVNTAGDKTEGPAISNFGELSL
ncbi:hypothetical protein CR205_14995 [Alteribacter lacisalsi]|uniref:Uncharacterized protein n=1 Tax=Alteribacter lacisalsi TaxID=2045244 RepID=A0A2W0H791_9BACI|nr:hypothetical protein [Alteribacter lacisalsi]PYZ96977.1 hypothetical protein CR205_14995 [Alteribacter lacisalsi]